MDLQKFRSDPAKEVEGIVVPVGEDAWVRVARHGNRKYQTYLQEATKPLRRGLQLGTVKDEEVDAVVARAMARHILLDWGGLKEGGKELPYSRENAERLLTAPNYKEFRNFIADIATDQQMFRDQELAESAGKSETSSAGS